MRSSREPDNPQILGLRIGGAPCASARKGPSPGAWSHGPVRFRSRPKASGPTLPPPQPKRCQVWSASHSIHCSSAAGNPALEGARLVFRSPYLLSIVAIVGIYESNPEEGSISWVSPIAKALIGKQAGDVVEIDLPTAKRKLEIVSIRQD